MIRLFNRNFLLIGKLFLFNNELVIANEGSFDL